MELSPKRAAEYVLGIDLWRDFRAKERQIYEEANIPEDYRTHYNPNLSFRDEMRIRGELLKMMGHHTVRSTVMIVGLTGFLEVTHMVTSGM